MQQSLRRQQSLSWSRKSLHFIEPIGAFTTFKTACLPALSYAFKVYENDKQQHNLQYHYVPTTTSEKNFFHPDYKF